MDYTGLEYSYQPPQFDFPDVGGFNFAPQDFSFDLTGAMPSFDAGAMPAFDMSSPFNAGPIAPSSGMFNEGLIPHNYLSPQQAPGLMPQQQPQPGGLGGMFGSLGLADWLKIAGAGAPLLAGLIGAFKGPQQGVTSTTTATRPAAPPMSPQEAQALRAALLGTQAADPRLIEQAFQPQLGSLLQQAIEQARQAGFHTNPLESPVADRIMSQGLADLQGQMAAAKLSQGQYASTLGQTLQGQLGQQRIGGMGGQYNSQTTGVQPNYFSSLSKDLGGLLGSLGGALGTLRPATYQQPSGGGMGGGISLSGYR